MAEDRGLILGATLTSILSALIYLWLSFLAAVAVVGMLIMRPEFTAQSTVPIALQALRAVVATTSLLGALTGALAGWGGLRYVLLGLFRGLKLGTYAALGSVAVTIVLIVAFTILVMIVPLLLDVFKPFSFWVFFSILVIGMVLSLLAPIVSCFTVPEDEEDERRSREILGHTCLGRRPSFAQLKSALQSANDPKWSSLLHEIDNVKIDPKKVQQWVEQVQSFSWEEQFVARQVSARYGGLAIKAFLELDTETYLAHEELLLDIAADTRRRLKPNKGQAYLCQRCLTGIVRHRHTIGYTKSTALAFYGCRRCAQGHDVMRYSGQVVAVLDPNMNGRIERRNGDIRVNWLKHSQLCDFERVDIVEASDAQVEGFVIHVRNDADDFRQTRYRSVPCHLDPQCHISENSRRALEKTFRGVKTA